MMENQSDKPPPPQRGKNGGKRPGAGRKKGTKDKGERRPRAGKDITLLARGFGVRAIRRLAAIMDNPKAPFASQVAACNSLLDRGYGRAPAVVEIKQEIRYALDLDRLNDEELRWYHRIALKARVPMEEPQPEMKLIEHDPVS